MKCNKPIYILAASQISINQPLTDQWLDEPIIYNNGEYHEAIDPQFKQWLSPGEARRLGKIMKRAVATSDVCMKQSGITDVDAIITATGLGCVKNTELFLNDLCTQGEQLLKPTQFMQSTHNTIGSLIAILNKCHGYNVTYAHGDISIEIAFNDAITQLLLGDINSALIGAHDEMTPCYYTLLERIGYYGYPDMVPSGETAVSFMLSSESSSKPLCKIDDIKLLYHASESQIIDHLKSLDNIGCIVAGYNGKPAVDKAYSSIISAVFPDTPVLKYKKIFGENMTASAFGIYAAATMLSTGKMPPAQLWLDGKQPQPDNAGSILCINLSGNNFASIKLSGV